MRAEAAGRAIRGIISATDPNQPFAYYQIDRASLEKNAEQSGTEYFTTACHRHIYRDSVCCNDWWIRCISLYLF